MLTEGNFKGTQYLQHVHTIDYRLQTIVIMGMKISSSHIC